MSKKQKRPLKKLTKKMKSGKVQAFIGGILAAAVGQLFGNVVEVAQKKMKSMKKNMDGKRHSIEAHA